MEGIDVEVMVDYFYVLLIFMIFFFFDWFIGGDFINFCNNGNWCDSWNVVMLLLWDVGIDSGIMFIVDDVEISF